MKETSVSIVILNYLNYMDTIECLESIREKFVTRYPVIVVDNGSSNESPIVLGQYCKEHDGITLIKARCNYGFSKGNNIGIKFARSKFHSKFVLVINNDTLITDEHYIDTLISKYEPNVGVIGSRIELKDGAIQPRQYFSFSLRNVIRWLIGSKNGWELLIPPSSNMEISEYLHGCSLLFTPDFFSHYNGFDSRTFLYGEEFLLYIMCDNAGLTQRYVAETSIYHKEDCSSNMSFHNDSSIMKSYQMKSIRVLFFELVKKTIRDSLKRRI